MSAQGRRAPDSVQRIGQPRAFDAEVTPAEERVSMTRVTSARCADSTIA